ncbi:MAG: hypothetical protein KIT84_12170 [Labilithrix sp.]|nr:hypothetical protein [Labilithrix sp.]MCW5811768.1 hypothetical protein [Labilithrix sp.]
MRRFGSLLGVLALGACTHGSWGRGGTSNEIVFGIEQSRLGVAAGYEFIGLAKHGGSAAVAFRDGDGRGRCWFERLDTRLGRPHVENGVATWSGGSLPSEGLTVLANQPDLVRREGAAWTSDDTLFFYAEGFAMPPLEGVRMRAPLVQLAIGDVTPAPDATTGALALDATSEVSVKWTPPVEDTRSRVMVALTTDLAEVRCFDDAANGGAVIGNEWIARLLAASTKDDDAGAGVTGTMTVASHRQTTLFAEGDWIVYVVAAHVHRDIAFTMR